MRERRTGSEGCGKKEKFGIVNYVESRGKCGNNVRSRCRDI